MIAIHAAEPRMRAAGPRSLCYWNASLSLAM
jgi:hypothetical protein